MSKRDGTCVQVVLLGVFSVLGRWVVAGALQQLIAVRAALVGWFCKRGARARLRFPQGHAVVPTRKRKRGIGACHPASDTQVMRNMITLTEQI